MGVTRRHIGQHGYHTLAAQRQQRDHLIIVSGIQINLSIGQMHDLRNLGNISGSFLYAHDIIHILYQFRDGLRSDIHTGAALDIIQNDRNGNTVGDRGIMCDQPLLCCLIIIWRYEQQSVRTVLFRLL